mgnify:CR=1 FL=1
MQKINVYTSFLTLTISFLINWLCAGYLNISSTIFKRSPNYKNNQNRRNKLWRSLLQSSMELRKVFKVLLYKITYIFKMTTITSMSSKSHIACQPCVGVMALKYTPSPGDVVGPISFPLFIIFPQKWHALHYFTETWTVERYKMT